VNGVDVAFGVFLEVDELQTKKGVMTKKNKSSKTEQNK
jgi:hypothetical protein